MLSVGEELQEVDQSRTEFQTQLPTIYCGNVGDGEFIVQVCVITPAVKKILRFSVT